jgi:hypothetical protein
MFHSSAGNTLTVIPGTKHLSAKGRTMKIAKMRKMRKKLGRKRMDIQNKILDRIAHGRRKASSVWTVGGGLPGSGKRN